jgi:hypothetical protein
MKRTIPFAGLVLGLALAAAVPAVAGVSFGVSVGGRGGDQFYLAVGDYYRVPQNEIVVVRKQRIPDEELPVVFFIAQRGHVAPAKVVKLRRSGKTWMQVALHFGVGPEAFYVASTRTDGPYGRAYGYYRQNGRDRWGRIRLADEDIVNFVNLRFLSDHYRCRPEQVVQWRAEGRGFAQIDENLRHPADSGRHGMRGPQEKQERVYREDPRTSRAPDARGNGRGHNR